MLSEDALEAFDVSAAGGLASALRRAEPAQMAIGDAGLGKMGRELVLGEALLARDRCCADVEDLLDAGIFEGADEAGDGPALIADGADRFRRHVESLLPSPRWSGASKSQTLRGPPAFCLAGQEANGSVRRCGTSRDIPGCGSLASRAGRAYQWTAASSGTHRR